MSASIKRIAGNETERDHSSGSMGKRRLARRLKSERESMNSRQLPKITRNMRSIKRGIRGAQLNA